MRIRTLTTGRDVGSPGLTETGASHLSLPGEKRKPTQMADTSIAAQARGKIGKVAADISARMIRADNINEFNNRDVAAMKGLANMERGFKDDDAYREDPDKILEDYEKNVAEIKDQAFDGANPRVAEMLGRQFEIRKLQTKVRVTDLARTRKIDKMTNDFLGRLDDYRNGLLDLSIITRPEDVLSRIDAHSKKLVQDVESMVVAGVVDAKKAQGLIESELSAAVGSGLRQLALDYPTEVNDIINVKKDQNYLKFLTPQDKTSVRTFVKSLAEKEHTKREAGLLLKKFQPKHTRGNITDWAAVYSDLNNWEKFEKEGVSYGAWYLVNNMALARKTEQRAAHAKQLNENNNRLYDELLGAQSREAKMRVLDDMSKLDPDSPLRPSGELIYRLQTHISQNKERNPDLVDAFNRGIMAGRFTNSVKFFSTISALHDDDQKTLIKSWNRFREVTATGENLFRKASDTWKAAFGRSAKFGQSQADFEEALMFAMHKDKIEITDPRINILAKRLMEGKRQEVIGQIAAELGIKNKFVSKDPAYQHISADIHGGRSEKARERIAEFWDADVPHATRSELSQIDEMMKRNGKYELSEAEQGVWQQQYYQRVRNASLREQPVIAEDREDLMPNGDRIKFLGAEHTYTRNGQVLTSVTQAINTVFPKFEEEEALDRAMVGPNYRGMSREEIARQWAQKREWAIERGNRVHGFGQYMLGGREFPPEALDEEEQGMFDGVRAQVEKYIGTKSRPGEWEVVATEKVLAAPGLDVAGTADIVLQHKKTGEILIADWKTGDKLTKANRKHLEKTGFGELWDQKFDKYSMQLELYRQLWIEGGFGHKGQKISTAIWQVHSKGTIKEHSLKGRRTYGPAKLILDRF